MYVIKNPDGLYIGSNYSRNISWVTTPFLFATPSKLKAYLGRVKGYINNLGPIDVWVSPGPAGSTWTRIPSTTEPFEDSVIQTVSMNVLSEGPL